MVLLSVLAAAGLVAVPAWSWQASLLPSSYGAHDMGVVDLGGGPAPQDHGGHGAGAGGHETQDGHGAAAVSVEALAPPADRPADVSITLTARAEPVELGDGTVVDGYTVNGTSPGPEIRVVQGQLVEVRLVNESVEGGTTLHWHGVDVPGGMDGVAGVTQDAVRVGGEHVYRFVAEDAGTYWYHSHQLSHEQVRRGLLGALVVEPADGTPAGDAPAADVVALVHQYAGRRTMNGATGDVRHLAEPGSTVRVRVVSTDNGALTTWVSGAPFRLLAVDGTDLVGPTELEDVGVQVTAGARADLELVVPPGGARVEVGGGTALVVGPAGADPVAEPRPYERLDLLTYGTPAPTGLDPSRADREFGYRIVRRPGFLDGRPGLWWTVNGRMLPDVPMFLVEEGDVVRMTITNSSGDGHPMHLHGHHALVLSRDGEPATGSPWWVDSLHVGDGETYEIAFLADNPGVWMDHCHNLPHAAEGLVAHLAYAGVTTPFLLGGVNEPE
ncbi:multicopper oxidase family protein [Aquipuribacter hungaricus]|uniref:multicopper oxidase family protein n=1 Tax=Aquipuribacter hungaricus TaxID=545624 RepID=UPI0030EEF9A0